jgi:DNA polymerase III subunit delta'
MTNTLSALPKSLLPWQATPWQQLWLAKKNNRLAHALLFVGANGVGKRYFAEMLATAVLCSKVAESGEACEECHSCHMMKAKTHPDLLLIEPEKEGQAIVVDQIREAIKRVNETTSQGGYKVIIITPASAMNTNAANALLKTLEEPTANTLMILISDPSLRLPATVISRCQKIIFPKASNDDAIAWLSSQMTDAKIDTQQLLQLADGAPFKALAFIKTDMINLRNEVYHNLYSLTQGQADPLQVASKWQDADQLSLIDLILSWATDLLRFKLSQEKNQILNKDYEKQLTACAQVISVTNLLSYLDYLQQVRTDLVTPINLNKQLVLDDILIRWVKYVSS